MDDPAELVGKSLGNGKYRIESLVQEGGFGIVYRAVESRYNRSVAIKVLKLDAHGHTQLRRSRLDDFEAEAKIVANLSHPATVRLFDEGSWETARGETVRWMAFEWIEGETLADELTRRRGKNGRTPAECLELLRPVFEAITEAHEKGITHRDIKPGNIMLARVSNEISAVRLLDFGIAKIMEPTEDEASNTTTATDPKFTRQYASPEQILYKRTGPWTDVHALGLLLTELLTDTRPYSLPNKSLADQAY